MDLVFCGAPMDRIEAQTAIDQVLMSGAAKGCLRWRVGYAQREMMRRCIEACSSPSKLQDEVRAGCNVLMFVGLPVFFDPTLAPDTALIEEVDVVRTCAVLRRLAVPNGYAKAEEA